MLNSAHLSLDAAVDVLECDEVALNPETSLLSHYSAVS
jgi:hypothetical protein